MKLLTVLLVALLASACQTAPPALTPDPEPDPLTVSFRTYFATGGGAQLLMFEDIAASRPATVTVHAECTITDASRPVPWIVSYEGDVTLETLGSNRTIPRKHVGVDMGPGIINCWPITATHEGVSVPITER